VDNSGTIATDDRLHTPDGETADGLTNGNSHSPSPISSSISLTVDTGPINENLFLDDDLDEELQNLDLDK